MTHVGSPTPSPERRRRNPQATRDRLVRSALELFTTRGYHASTTPQIAAAAGVAEGTIYRHFDSKEHLLNELYRAAVRLLTDQIAQASKQAGCRAQLDSVAAAWLGIAKRDPALIRLVFFARHGPLLDPRSRDARRHLETELSRIVASGKAAGEIRTGPADIWVRIWVALVVMALERVVEGEWPEDHGGPAYVFEAAWDAVRARGGGDPSGQHSAGPGSSALHTERSKEMDS